MKVFISGKITGVEDSRVEKFTAAQRALEDMGHRVINPTVLPLGFKHEEYMHICRAMIDVCEAVVVLRDWEDSKGAIEEINYTEESGKSVLSFDELMFDEYLDQLVDLREEKRNDMKGDIIGPEQDYSVHIRDYLALDWAVTELLKHRPKPIIAPVPVREKRE